MGHFGFVGMLIVGASAAASRAAGPAAASPAPPPQTQPGGRVCFDFETGDLQGWRVVEGQFAAPVNGRETFRNLQNRQRKWNKQGRYFLDTVNLPGDRWDDGQTGVIESPVFELTGPKVSFLLGGGGHAGTYVALCTADGTEALRACGHNGEIMQRVAWDARALVGKKVFVRIVDRQTAGWGHVTFDDFQASGRIDPNATAERWAKRAELEEARQARELAEAKARAEQLTAERARRIEAISDPALLFQEGQMRVYRGEDLGAISLPVGGIAAGCIHIDGRAVRHDWRIFNSMAGAAVPDSFFAVRAAPAGGSPVVRAVQTAPAGTFAAMKALTFRGEYPFGWYDFEDGNLPVAVSLEAFSPLIPLRARDSAIPCAIFNLTARNGSQGEVEVSFLAAQQNAAGYAGAGVIEGRRAAGYGGNRNRVLAEGAATILHMTTDAAGDAAGYGDLALAAVAEDVTATASWEAAEALLGDFSGDGALDGSRAAGPSPAGETLNGALATRFRLPPGGSKTVTFVLAWHFPNARHGAGKWGGEGNMYANWWAGALDAAREVCKRRDELTGLTRLYHDTLYATNLPRWLLDRVSSQVAVLRSRTCFWTKDGYFGGWEGCYQARGCCQGNCAHVWHYAQAHGRLFPSIARRMREQSLGFQDDAGGIPFRHPGGKVAFDGQCGEVLEACREHLCSPDGKWLAAHWARIRKAMEFVIATWDADEDGVPTGQQHNTLDAELSGSTSWLGTLYLAALAACERMAETQGQGDLARRYRTIRLSGAKKQDETLFEGEYYIQVPDEPKGENYLTGCHIDQLLGQWWAHQLDLGWLYPPERVRTALGSLFRHNFRTDFVGVKTYTTGSPARGQPRKFVHDDDCGMLMTTWPKGGRPGPGKCLRFADEVMSGFEYSAAATMVASGLMREAFAVVKGAADRYDGRLRTGLTDRAWGYSGNPFGDDECGKYYARAMSSWSMLTACQGFLHDGPGGVIGFRPAWRPEDHRSFFTAAEGWGLFAQKRQGARQSERIELRYGKLAVSALVFAPAEDAKAARVSVTAGGKKVEATHKLQGDRLTVSLSAPLVLRAGEVLEVVLEQPGKPE